jgi:hypothetical protein
MLSVEIDTEYTYKGRVYRVTACEPGKYLVKDADSGNWQDAVTYVSAEKSHAEGMTFIRSRNDFMAKFQLNGGDCGE